MNTVTLATHCHSRDLPRLHAPGELEKLIDSHQYPFDVVMVIHQRCGDMPFEISARYNIEVYNIKAEDYPTILRAFGMDPDDPDLARICHGPSWQWWWQNHCVNHCKEIIEATTDYIVFNDADCKMIRNDGRSWVYRAIEILETHPEVFIVSPSDGGHEMDRVLEDGTRLVKTTSQQLFMGRRTQLQEMDFTNLRWNGQFDAPGGPFQEWYGLFEGHLGRWMKHIGIPYRAILPETHRYFHGQWH